MNSAADYTVRELEARDIPVLQDAFAEWAPAHWNANDATDAPVSARRFRVLVLYAGGREQLAGIAEYQQILDEGHLHGIAIVPSLQRRGLGMKLLLAVLAELRTQGCTRCLLEVRRSNLAAQALYERAHFTRDGVRKDYYPAQTSGQREDALLYSCLL